MDGRVAQIRDLLSLLAVGAAIFLLDAFSPPTLAVSVAYAGVALFVARPARARLALAFAVLATGLIAAGLALDGQRTLALSDALVSALLAIVLVWMVVLVGTSRGGTPRPLVRIRETPGTWAGTALESHIDIVKLTEAQRALLDRLNLATQTAGLAIWDRDVIANTVYVDNSFAKVFGMRVAHSFQDVRRVIHPDDLARVEESHQAPLCAPDTPSVVTDRFRIHRETDGALRHIQCHRRLFRNASGRVERVLGVAWDITDEVTAAQALMEATEAAHAASRAKSTLLANVSHEIRTPMNGIIGMTALLLDDTLSASQREYAETIRGSADSLLRVIDDILDFSKIEAGRMAVESVRTDVRRTIEDVRALMSPQAAQKNLALHVRVDPAIPPRVMSDPQRLRQCLVNLVGNAIKFTQAGSVTIVVRQVPQAQGEPMTRFEVRDTGIGIDATAMSRLFEPFVQADSSTTRNFGGTGLGLSIVKRFVEMMGGSVGASSVVGEGSSFWFDLPLVAIAGSEAMATGATSSMRVAGPFEARFSGRVLVVEDNNVNQKVARRILERLGCEVEIAGNGAQALEMCAGTTFDLILMDMQMPVMDGVTATTALRQRETGKRRTPVIALTANAMSGEYDRCMAVGMDGFLTKPLSIERLSTVLSGFGLRNPEVELLESMPAQRASLGETVTATPINLAKLQGVTGGDPEFAKELLDTFLASADESLNHMTLALRAGDREHLARIVHRLKGAALNVHADAIAQLTVQLEQQAQGTASIEVLAAAIEECRGLIGQVAEFVRQRPDSMRAA